jgi:hypothetical protein
MPDSITREELMREVGDRLDADPALVARRVGSAGRRVTEPEAPAAAADAGARPPLSARERREVALLAMCMAVPAEGQPFLERLTPEHFTSPVAGRALGWLRLHLEDPLKELGRDDEDLLRFVTDVKMESERAPGSRQAIEINFLELERGLVERQIAAAQPNGGAALVELQKKRAELNERIARAGG